ncbi:unnamed protein product [Rotaria sp. Silwood2]|nr:unnamed protein product [Rotaria sp. Silwood2]CAF4610055.1 unnamed protein product [Rotaria sp. Silwood2]
MGDCKRVRMIDDALVRYLDNIQQSCPRIRPRKNACLSQHYCVKPSPVSSNKLITCFAVAAEHCNIRTVYLSDK